MLRFAFLIVSLSTAFSTGAFAQDYACPMSQRDAQRMASIGYTENGQQVMHLSLDQASGSVVVWETYPGGPTPSRATYKANFTGSTVAWTIGDDGDQDDPPAHDSLDLGSNTLTTVDPMGDATTWDCAPN
jgi:hypothetical protein